MNTFIYKKIPGITALSASFSEFEYKKHSHGEYALGVTLRGVQQYYSGGCFHSSHESGIVLFNPEQAHDGRAQDKSGIDYIMLYIEPDLLTKVMNQKNPIRFSDSNIYDKRLSLKIRELGELVFREQDDALCAEKLTELADCLGNSEFSASKTDDDLTRKAKKRISESPLTVLKLDDICKELSVSKFKFIRAFKASAGISPYQYFLNIKLEAAKRIIEAEKDVYAAVAACGFNDLTHLNRHFKSVYGTTAFEYLSYLK